MNTVSAPLPTKIAKTKPVEPEEPKGYLALSKLRIQPGTDSAGTHTPNAELRLWHVPAEDVVVLQKLRQGITVNVRRFPLAGGFVGFYELMNDPLMPAST